VKQLILQRLAEVQASILTLPTRGVWWRCALAFVCFTACAGAFGSASGFLRFEPTRTGQFALLLLALHLLFTPAIIEEIIFRALLLPRNSSAVPRHQLMTICAFALGLFVASHVVNGLFFRCVGVFLNPAFLLLAAMPGAACITTFLISRSIWPDVIIRWTTVLAWIALLGGRRLLTHV